MSGIAYRVNYINYTVVYFNMAITQKYFVFPLIIAIQFNDII